MFTGFEFFFFIPLITYAIVICVVVWLAMRLIRANEKIAMNTDKIARALADRNEIERNKV
jgi:hypothetical protein